jgi:hypothetical protein
MISEVWVLGKGEAASITGKRDKCSVEKRSLNSSTGLG